MTTESIIFAAQWGRFLTGIERLATAINKPYSVTLFGSHPDEQNDDAWTGDDFATIEEASAVFQATVGGGGPFNRTYFANWQYIMLDGPGINLIAKNPSYSAKRARREQIDSDREWQRECAMQAGMAFGCDGYNDEMGW